MKYDAFISYSQSADGELADALQSGLQRLGRPWYQPRPTMRVFRDKTGFGASEDLTESIREVLDSSSYLILLLSPQAASSQWVDEEVSHWIARKEAGHVLPVVTGWDSPPGTSSENLGRFRWNGADVPRALRAYYETEPLAVDLRWAITGRDLHLRNERFTEAVAEVASPILGKQKDELIGETIRLRRKARRLAIGAIVGLVILTFALTVASLVAVQNARRANERTRVAQSRQLAAQATSLAEGDVDVALLLAVEAMRIDPTAEARSALLRTVTRHPGLSLYLHPDRGKVNDLRFAEDGTLAAVSAGSTLSVWGPDDPLNPSHLETDTTASLNSFDLDRGAAYAVAGGDTGDLLVFDLAAGTGRVAIPGAHDGRITVVRFLAGGRNLVTAGSDGTMAFWSFQDGNLASDSSVAVGGGVNDLVIVEDQDLVVVGLDNGAVEVWRLSQPMRLGGVTRPIAVNALAYSPESDLLAAGGADGRVALYQLPSLEEIADLPATRASLVSVAAVVFSNDGRRLFAGNADGTIRMWTAPAWAELSTELGGHTGTVSAFAVSFDGTTLASGASDQAVILWDLTSPSVIAEPIDTPKTATGALAVSTTNLLAVGGIDGAVVWDLDTGEWVLPNLSAVSRPVTAMAFDPDGKSFAYGTSGGDMVVWDVIGDKLTQEELGAHSGSDSLLPAVLDLTMDNQVVVSAGTDGAVRMWSEGGVEDLATHHGGATSVDLEGSTLISTGADLEVHVWRPPGAAVESVLPGALTAAIAPGEGVLALQDAQGGIVLWNLETETRIGRLWGATAPPTRLSFSPDGSILASGHQNGDVLLWDPVNLVAIGGPLRAHNDAVQSIEFHPSGSHLFSNALDGTVIAWDLQVIAWAQHACRVANRDLTEAEWTLYLGPAEPYRATCSTLAEETFDGVAGPAVTLRLPAAPAGP